VECAQHADVLAHDGGSSGCHRKWDIRRIPSGIRGTVCAHATCAACARGGRGTLTLLFSSEPAMKLCGRLALLKLMGYPYTCSGGLRVSSCCVAVCLQMQPQPRGH